MLSDQYQNAQRHNAQARLRKAEGAATGPKAVLANVITINNQI